MHGLPAPAALEPGDVVKLDVTAAVDGYVADAAVTVVVPPASTADARLAACARAALADGMAQARAGAPCGASARRSSAACAAAASPCCAS